LLNTSPGLRIIFCGGCKNDSRHYKNFSRFPFSGRVVPELGNDSIREWFAYSYRVICRVENDIVTVAAIVHGKRLLELE
jgi:plasmid stabilization system protein ParE